VTTHYSLHTQEGRINIRLDSLPPVARRKFAALQALAEDNAALTKVALAREKGIEDALYDAQRRRSICNPNDEPERAAHLSREAADVQAELDRLHAARMRRESVRSNTEQIVAQLKFNFLAAEDYMFPQVRAYDGPPAHPRDGEDLKAAVTRIRGEISRVQAELTRVKQAPLTPDEAKATVIAEINRLAALGKPQLSITDGGNIKVWFPDQQMHSVPGQARSRRPAPRRRCCAGYSPTRLSNMPLPISIKSKAALAPATASACLPSLRSSWLNLRPTRSL
jgi:hypothetical protein